MMTIRDLKSIRTYDVVPTRRLVCRPYAHICLTIFYKIVNEFKLNTCIDFQLAENSDTANFTVITQDPKASACRTIANKIYLNPTDCSEYQIWIHEFMHALGFDHEFQRPDRDFFIDMNYGKLREYPEITSQFKVNKAMESFNAPYDYNSVTTTSGYLFKNGVQLMKSKDPRVSIQAGHELSQWDVYKINTVYPCEEFPPRTNSCKRQTLCDDRYECYLLTGKSFECCVRSREITSLMGCFSEKEIEVVETLLNWTSTFDFDPFNF